MLAFPGDAINPLDSRNLLTRKQLVLFQMVVLSLILRLVYIHLDARGILSNSQVDYLRFTS